MNDMQDKIDAALTVARRYGGTEEMHHEAWVVDQMVRALTGDEYNAWISETKSGGEGPDRYSWNTGIAP